MEADKAAKDKDKEQPLSVCFVRHGQAEAREPGDVRDPGLTELGRQQAELVARRLKRQRFAHIYTSDLARAKETAAAIRLHHPQAPVTETAELREVMFYNFLSGFSPTKRAERKILSREGKTMRSFVGKLLKEHKVGEKVLVVAHGNLIRCMLALLSGKNPKRSVVLDINNTSVTIIEVWLSGGAVVRTANSLEHLGEGQVT